MFGLTILTKKDLEKMRSDMRKQSDDRAVASLVELLKMQDRIFLAPVTLKGDHQVITNCTFLGIDGTALRIDPPSNTAWSRPPIMRRLSSWLKTNINLGGGGSR